MIVTKLGEERHVVIVTKLGGVRHVSDSNQTR